MQTGSDGMTQYSVVRSFIHDFLAGGSASAVSETIMAPLERIKLILQVQSVSKQIAKEEHYKGLLDALKRIPAEQGFFSLWRGNTISIIRCFPTHAFNFAFKDKLQQYFLKDVDIRKDHGGLVVGNLAAGGVAGAISLTLVYPLDLARTRIAADVGAGFGAKTGKILKQRQFTGIFDCIQKTSKSHGFLGLYQGWNVSIIGIAIYRAFYYGIYDTAKVLILEENAPIWQRWITAQSSVATAGLIAFPIDSVRRRMMMQVGEKTEDRKFRSVSECFRKTFVEDGIRGFYRGAVTNIIRSSGGALVLILYDEIKNILNKKVDK